MISGPEKNEREEIRNILRSIRDAWVNGRSEDLEEFFHEDMVIVGPGFQGGGKGRKACVASYAAFSRMADIKDVQESDLSIDVWNNTAVAHYKFMITYRMAGKDHRDTGYDLFVFTQEEGKWSAVWRTILPENEAD